MKRFYKAAQEASENATIDLFINSPAEIKGGMKKGSYGYIETMPTTLAKKEALDEVFDRFIKRWVDSNLFMNAVTRAALNLPRFTQPVETFVKPHMEKTAKEWRIPVKVEAVPPLVPSDLGPQLLSLSPFSDEDEREKHHKNLCKDQAPSANYSEM